MRRLLVRLAMLAAVMLGALFRAFVAYAPLGTNAAMPIRPRSTGWWGAPWRRS